MCSFVLHCDIVCFCMFGGYSTRIMGKVWFRVRFGDRVRSSFNFEFGVMLRHWWEFSFAIFCYLERVFDICTFLFVSVACHGRLETEDNTGG